MKYLCVLLLLLVPSPSVAEQRTRPLDSVAVEAFEQAFAGSPLVRDLVRQLEHSDVIVHIVSERQLPGGAAGITRLVASQTGVRYLRIAIDSTLRPLTRAAILGHELQHACEVAASGAHDVESMRQLFQSAGHRPTPAEDVFETSAALKVERQVSRDLRSRQGVSPRPTFAQSATAGRQDR
jgi:hypothetical protein